MIVISGALVLVALVLLVIGVVDPSLAFVYASIAVSLVSLVFLVIGILQRRGEPLPGAEACRSRGRRDAGRRPAPRRATAVDPAAEPHRGRGARRRDGPRTSPRTGGTVLVVAGRPRYHVAGCRYLTGKDAEGVDVRDAREEGFTACGVCKPDDALAAAEPAETDAEDAPVVEDVPGAVEARAGARARACRPAPHGRQEGVAPAGRRPEGRHAHGRPARGGRRRRRRHGAAGPARSAPPRRRRPRRRPARLPSRCQGHQGHEGRPAREGRRGARPRPPPGPAARSRDPRARALPPRRVPLRARRRGRRAAHARRRPPSRATTPAASASPAPVRRLSALGRPAARAAERVARRRHRQRQRVAPVARTPASPQHRVEQACGVSPAATPLRGHQHAVDGDVVPRRGVVATSRPSPGARRRRGCRRRPSHGAAPHLHPGGTGGEAAPARTSARSAAASSARRLALGQHEGGTHLALDRDGSTGPGQPEDRWTAWARQL